MTIRRMPRLAATAAAALLLAGCAAPNMQAALKEANDFASPIAGGAQAELRRDDSQRDEAARLSADLLSKPLTMDGAAQLAMSNSPAFQAALAQSWGELAQAHQRGLPGGVLFSFERLREGADLQIGRLLSFGLFDLITLPQRQAVSRLEGEQGRVRMAGTIVDQVSAARRAWVMAVAAREIEIYATQVRDAADASAELARRMQSVGNFTKLQSARQHLFYADATSRLASARQAAVSTREELVRQLGLADAQAASLKLPDRLPDLPKSLPALANVEQQAMDSRLDLQVTKLQTEALAKNLGLTRSTRLINVLELGVINNGSNTEPHQRGYEITFELPLFDWGQSRVVAAESRYRQALERARETAVNARSEVREAYAMQQGQYAIAKHLRDEVVPLKKRISEENVLRYNGMLIGVFELLADARSQIASVNAAIEAQRDYWLAESDLQMALVGTPGMMAAPSASSASAEAAGGH